MPHFRGVSNSQQGYRAWKAHPKAFNVYHYHKWDYPSIGNFLKITLFYGEYIWGEQDENRETDECINSVDLVRDGLELSRVGGGSEDGEKGKD